MAIMGEPRRLESKSGYSRRKYVGRWHKPPLQAKCEFSPVRHRNFRVFVPIPAQDRPYYGVGQCARVRAAGTICPYVGTFSPIDGLCGTMAEPGFEESIRRA